MIRVSDVHKSFGDEKVLDGISFIAERGEIIGIEGRNGSGKSVLLKCILGFVRYDSGNILVKGEKVNGAPPKTPIGFLIDSPGYLPDTSAFRNLSLIAGINRIASPEDIKKLLEMVGLDPRSRKKVSRYSLGMKQKLGLAQALMENPPILILDEPFNGLDRKSVEMFKKLIAEQARLGKTILMTSHNQADLYDICTRTLDISR